MKRHSLAALRLRLTAWYLGTFAVILTLLGVGLLYAIHAQFVEELDGSLRQSTTELIRAAHTREIEAANTSGVVVDAVEELRIPNQQLYLLNASGESVIPSSTPNAVATAGRQALDHGNAGGVIALVAAGDGEEGSNDHQDEGDRRYYAERFTLASGDTMVAVATADVVELQERYSSLILAFGAAALVALVLVAAGGWLLVRKSTAPIERNIEQMRQFMADAAHELRTPVTVVRTRAEIALQQPRDSDAYVATLKGIEAEGKRLGLLVDDLFTLARADAGQRPIELQRLFLDDLLLDAADAARALGRQSGVAVEVVQFEETAVDGDAPLLRQLAMILLDNAVKFTRSGGKVEVSVAPLGGTPTLIVRDTGEGIDAEHLPHLFERFFRGDAARTSHAPDGAALGAGLGLSIAKWICDAHRASITIASTPGVGTTVTVTFPPAA